MKQSARLILLVLTLVLFGRHFAKGQQDETDEVDADSAYVDEQNGTNQPSDGTRAGRIIGAIPVTSANQLYAVVLNPYKGTTSYNMAGAIISNTEVITSASALAAIGKITKIVLAVGMNPTVSSGTVFNYLNYIPNRGFNPTTLANDVAIVRINGTFAGVPNVNPIAMATTSLPVTTTNRPQCVVVGWGQNGQGGLTGSVAEMGYELMTDAECAAGGANISSIVCARPAELGHACDMDGGAPLVCNGQLYGILTEQTNCIFARAPAFQKFAKLPVIFPPPASASSSAASSAATPRKNYVSCP